MNKYRYNYGRQANRTLAKIQLPSLDELPDWVNEIDVNLPGGFAEPEINRPSPVTKLKELGYGPYPYVTTQATNNGVEGLYDYYTEQGKCANR